MYRPISQQPFPQNVSYQQSHQTHRPDISRPPFLQQQFSPRFKTPPQRFPPSGSFYQSPQEYHDHPGSPNRGPVQPQGFYQPSNLNINQVPKPPFQPPVQNFNTTPKPPHQLPPIPNFKTPPPPVDPSFNQSLVTSFRTPGHSYKPFIQNFNQPPVAQNYGQPPIQNFNHHPPPIQNFNQPPPPPPPIQNYNQPLVQNFNNPPPMQNFNQPPPVQNYNQSVNPAYKTLNQSEHQPVCSPHQSPNPAYGPSPNVPYCQPQVHGAEPLKPPHNLSIDQCYQQQQITFNIPRHEFQQRLPFRPPGPHRFPFNNQQPRYQQLQHGNIRFQFHPRLQYQNYRSRGPPPNINNQFKCNNVLQKDKSQVACDLDDCDFVGHASAVKEHQNMHHRLGLHKKVLYSNNSDAIKNWIQERKKKWPTKETIQIKLEIEEEKNKRGERIADEDFQRFNKNNKFNNSGSKRFNNRKRTKFNSEFVEPIEEPMNGNLKRFAGIVEVKKEDNTVDESSKPVALKLLEEYDESSDDEPPIEIAIVKESSSQDKSPIEDNKELCSVSNIKEVFLESSEEINTTLLGKNDSNIVDLEMKTESCSKVFEEDEKTNTKHCQKRKKSSKKDSKPIKKLPPLRTPRTEVVERKSALLEALMGDLMRSERNAITQCICYIRNNMHRFCKIQAA